MQGVSGDTVLALLSSRYVNTMRLGQYLCKLHARKSQNLKHNTIPVSSVDTMGRVRIINKRGKSQENRSSPVPCCGSWWLSRPRSPSCSSGSKSWGRPCPSSPTSTIPRPTRRRRRSRLDPKRVFRVVHGTIILGRCDKSLIVSLCFQQCHSIRLSLYSTPRMTLCHF